MMPLFDDIPVPIQKTLKVLHGLEDWPVDLGKDVEFLTRMMELYPAVNVYEEAVGYSAWLSEHQSKKKVKHRARFRNWLRNADRWADRKPGISGHHRAEAGGHGTTGKVDRKW